MGSILSLGLWVLTPEFVCLLLRFATWVCGFVAWICGSLASCGFCFDLLFVFVFLLFLWLFVETCGFFFLFFFSEGEEEETRRRRRRDSHFLISWFSFVELESLKLEFHVDFHRNRVFDTRVATMNSNLINSRC